MNTPPTPLVPINLHGREFLAKLEFHNASGSVKDRVAEYIVEKARVSGELSTGRVIVEASSGNQGIALARIGARDGYRTIISCSRKISAEKLSTLKALGAEVIVCEPTQRLGDANSYYSVAKAIHNDTPQSFFPNQYFNPLNPEALYATLGPEIWLQTQGRITHLFAAAGTGGTVTGVGRFLKERNSAVQVIAVDHINSFRSTGGKPLPYKLEGIGIDFETPCLDLTVVDRFVGVSDDAAIEVMQFLARRKGLLVGMSAGAAISAIQSELPNLPCDAVVVVIVPDSGRAYLSKGVFGASE